jgi:hypothetical protein
MYRLWFEKSLTPRPPMVGPAERLLIGRDPGCQLRLTEPGVCTRHAAIDRRADGWYLCDLDSANGVRVNDQPVAEHRLTTGDRIEIGAVRLQFEVLHEGSGCRRFSPLQLTAATVIAVTVVGQLAVIGGVLLQPRSRDMRVYASVHVDDPPAQPVGPPPAPPAPAPVEPVTPPAPRLVTPVPVVLTRKIRVDRLERAGDLLRIVARAQVGERELDPTFVAVTAEPFTGTVSAGAPVAVPIPAWANFSSKLLTVRFASATRFTGFVVRTYYRGELQDVAATSPALLALVSR